jgi:hypothetical protein
LLGSIEGSIVVRTYALSRESLPPVRAAAVPRGAPTGDIVREHRHGRPLLEILRDAYVARCGSESLRWRVLQDPRTLEALRRNDADAFALVADELIRDR